jgi:hypothetical protein
LIVGASILWIIFRLSAGRQVTRASLSPEKRGGWNIMVGTGISKS